MTEFVTSYFVIQDSVRRRTMLRAATCIFLFTFLVLSGLAAPANAQLYAGSVTGVVSDQTGALIAEAELTLADANKGFTFATKTDDKGRDPGANNADLSIFKEFGLGAVHEGMRLECRFETFNTFNHPQFCPPDATFGSPTFGQIYYTCNSPRQVQMALKLYF